MHLPRPLLTATDRFLLALIRTGQGGGAPDGPEPENPATDWQELLATARRHRVEPLVLEAIQRLPPETLPTGLAGQARARRRAWMLRGMRQHELLAGACRALSGAGISGLVLKGAALGQFAYEEEMVRASADLDILVHRGQMPSARRALAEVGWTLRDPALSRRYHQRFHVHDVLVSTAGDVLELHWSLTRPDDLFRLEPSDFRDHAVTGPDGMLLSSPTDLLLHSAAQCMAEGFSRLLRIADCAGLLRLQAERLDWDRLLERARTGGLEPALWLLLHLSHELMGTPQPARSPAGPPRAARRALLALEPGTSLASGFGLTHPGLRGLFQLWLAADGRKRVRAAARLLRPQRLEAARRPERGRASDRLRRLLLRWRSALRLAAYQLACLWRSRSSAG